jgi:hypothetical protein
MGVEVRLSNDHCSSVADRPYLSSMHKSQGQTLERVKVDLGKVFEKGQGKISIIVTNRPL